MHSKTVEASPRLRWSVFGIVAVLTVLAVSTDPADARARRHRDRSGDPSASAYSPPYADIVVDVNSGEALRSTNPDSLRHPASLTKIMTLYMLFERLEAGTLKLNTPLQVSARATAQEPSKLGLKVSDTIEVEDAIKAIVTRSANDVAVIVAEAIGGSEDNFAQLMTRKARALGMSRTVYMNASGLPDDAQVTTARDQALLGRVIQEHFPRYFAYFSTPNFRYRGHMIANHNRLLGKVTGVDGIKTGYIRASGFNLVTSVRRGNRQLVAVVLGGRSASQRDARMRQLIDENIVLASIKRAAPAIAEAAEPSPSRPAQRIATAMISPARAEPAPTVPVLSAAQADSTLTAAISAPRPAAGSADPLLPLLVKTISVKPAAVKPPSLGPSPTETVTLAASTAMPVAREEALALPPVKPGVLGFLPVKLASAGPPTPMTSAPEHAAITTPSDAHRSGWLVQIGAFDQESEAKQRLNSAQSRAKTLLGSADAFTEPVTKGDKTFYRARFAGLDKDQAEAVCKYLKKNDITCMALKN
jgi:D-alanyl-D-alanine carboxypeptidase